MKVRIPNRVLLSISIYDRLGKKHYIPLTRHLLLNNIPCTSLLKDIPTKTSFFWLKKMVNLSFHIKALAMLEYIHTILFHFPSDFFLNRLIDPCVNPIIYNRDDFTFKIILPWRKIFKFWPCFNQ